MYSTMLFVVNSTIVSQHLQCTIDNKSFVDCCGRYFHRYDMFLLHTVSLRVYFQVKRTSFIVYFGHNLE